MTDHAVFKAPKLSQCDLHRIAHLCENAAGLSISPAKTAMVEARLSRRLHETGQTSFHRYLDFVDSEKGREERHELICALTTNVTGFFRENHHFEHFQARLLGELDESRRYILSAGCATGQEAYSIAMTAWDAFGPRAAQKITIEAFDINTKNLEIARTGMFSKKALAPLGETQRRTHFSETAPNSDLFVVRPHLRSMIQFEERNITQLSGLRAKFSVIFCRNVAIYFSRQTQDRVWASLVDFLCPGGTLYIGHSERISDPEALGVVAMGRTFYQKPNPFAPRCNPSTHSWRPLCH